MSKSTLNSAGHNNSANMCSEEQAVSNSHQTQFKNLSKLCQTLHTTNKYNGIPLKGDLASD